MALYSTIIVTCDSPSLPRSLDRLGLSGVCVGNVILRWAVEVPFGKEQEYAKLLEQEPCVKEVCPVYQKARFDDRQKRRQRT